MFEFEFEIGSSFDPQDTNAETANADIVKKRKNLLIIIFLSHKSKDYANLTFYPGI